MKSGEPISLRWEELITGVNLCGQKSVEFFGESFGQIWQQEVAPRGGYVPSNGHKLSIPPARMI